MLHLNDTGHIDFVAPGTGFVAKTLSIDKIDGRNGLVTLNQVLDHGSTPGERSLSAMAVLSPALLLSLSATMAD
ncbi:hypothetical protein [Methylophilus sp. Leaf408]|uniref:hypothetical protein n=1 Tax=Methylophilus sp. Leaf408 TaxID=2876561 RepID=UPI001E5224BB|nr:hypothetical protein [Methylophilus sp. Leaf408]